MGLSLRCPAPAHPWWWVRRNPAGRPNLAGPPGNVSPGYVWLCPVYTLPPGADPAVLSVLVWRCAGRALGGGIGAALDRKRRPTRCWRGAGTGRPLASAACISGLACGAARVVGVPATSRPPPAGRRASGGGDAGAGIVGWYRPSMPGGQVVRWSRPVSGYRARGPDSRHSPWSWSVSAGTSGFTNYRLYEPGPRVIPPTRFDGTVNQRPGANLGG